MPEVTPAMEAALRAGKAAAAAGRPVLEAMEAARVEAVAANFPELCGVERAVLREIRAREGGEELTGARAVALLNAATTLQRLALEALVEVDRLDAPFTDDGLPRGAAPC